MVLVLFSVFMAIGCTSNMGNNTQISATPTETPPIPVEEPATVPDSNVMSETGGEGKIVEVSIKNFSFNPEPVKKFHSNFFDVVKKF